VVREAVVLPVAEGGGLVEVAETPEGAPEEAAVLIHDA
jgi:hypothetical protein